MLYQNKTILITGASSGIGFALAEAFVQAGANVVLLARRKERIDSLCADLNRSRNSALGVACDVTDPAQLAHAVERALERFSKIDMVIANAGFGVVGRTERLTRSDFDRQFETNVFGVLNTFWASAKALKESHGHFVIIGSVMGYLSLPNTAPYSMSKFAVRALAQSLYHELYLSGVAVTYVAPGFVDTEIRKVDNHGNFHAHGKDPISMRFQMPAKKAAHIIVKKLRRRPREIVITRHGQLGVWFQRHFPGFTQWIIRITNSKGRESLPT